MRKDAKLPADINPLPNGQQKTGKLLLTGATGFFGSFVLEALLRLTNLEVVALSRAESNDHARTRTKSALQRGGLLTDGLLDAFEARVSTLSADMEKPHLGLSERDWDTLAAEASGIYHCAAEVDYVKPYKLLRDFNVAGTLELIRLASIGHPKTYHLASTTFIYGLTPRETCLENECNIEMSNLNFGYSQSKWVAEQLVLAAIDRGLNAKIYRPVFITASRDGQYVERDIVTRVYSYMIRHGISVNSENQLSMLPVDHCANNFVALSILPDPIARTYHLSADNYYTFQDTCNLISQLFGYKFEYVSIKQMVEHMNANCDKSDPLYPLLAFFNRHYKAIDSESYKRYDSRNYRKMRALTPHTLPEPPLSETISTLVSFLRQRNLVPVPSRASRKASRLSQA